jgi:hypothetical protein
MRGFFDMTPDVNAGFAAVSIVVASKVLTARIHAAFNNSPTLHT